MMVVMTVVSVFLIERIGRRILFLSGLSVMLGSAIIITIALALRDRASGLVFLAITFIYIFVGAFAIGPGKLIVYLDLLSFTTYFAWILAYTFYF